MSAETLRWILGLFCAFIGAFILVTPHRFTGTPYEGLLLSRTVWGVAGLASGVALLASCILRPRRPYSLAIHAAAGLTLLALAVSFGRTGAWTGMIAYGMLGLGLLGAGFLSYERDFRRDLFGCLMALIALADGAAMLLAPRWFNTAYFAPSRHLLPVLGILLLGSGALLCFVHWRPAPRWLVWTAHLAGGASYLVLALLVSLPIKAWTGVVLYAGGGSALAVLPWLSRRLSRLDTRALRTRMAMALALATSVALILAVAVATRQEELIATAQVQETRKIEAQALAHTVADTVVLNAARTAAAAAMAGRLPMDPSAQRVFLERTLPRHPGLLSLVTLERSGRVIAALGEIPLDSVRWRDFAMAAARDGRVMVQLLPLAGEATPHLVLSAPIVGLDGRTAGALVSVVAGKALTERLSRQGSNVYLADGHGQLIARAEGASPPLPSGGPHWPAGWDLRAAAGQPPASTERMASFALVPELGWVVAVEHPRQAALAGVREGRDQAFALLLLVVPLAVLGGIFAARRIARPLVTLADAVGELAAGNPAAPLGASDVSEVARLSTAFAEMRDRLAARTRESERLQTELRARAEALADSDRRKDEFLAMLGHELRNPLGAIANSAYILEQAGPLQPPADRASGVIRRQVQNLVRLVDDLLDVSRISRGKVELRRERIDLADVVRHAVDTLRPVLESKHHTLDLDLPAAPLPLVADATRLEQVVGNLLRNAAKYTDPGGHIAVKARRDGGEALLTVTDNGTGIAPDLLPRVFDLFTQGEQNLDRTGAGLGIGLTLVRSLVEMHGGHVAAHSDGPGTGTRMEVRLPLAE